MNCSACINKKAQVQEDKREGTDVKSEMKEGHHRCEE
jgi:hypothetical protein